MFDRNKLIIIILGSLCLPSYNSKSLIIRNETSVPKDRWIFEIRLYWKPNVLLLCQIFRLQSSTKQWRSQNTAKATHIKGRLLDQAVILFNCVPFWNENFFQRKELASNGSEFFSEIAVPYGMENHFYHINCLTWMLLFILRTCVTAFSHKTAR